MPEQDYICNSTVPFVTALSAKETVRHSHTCMHWNVPHVVYAHVKNTHGFLQVQAVDWLSGLPPMAELRSLCAAHFAILCLGWWNFTVISERAGERWCFLLTTALCIRLTTISQSKRDAKSSWKRSWFWVRSFSKTFYDAACDGHCVKLIALHLISSLSLFQVCHMHISFLPLQLFHITLVQLLFSFSTVANSVAGCLLRKVELRQFIQEKKNQTSVLRYTFLVAVSRHSLFRPPPVDPKQPKLPLTALYEVGLQTYADPTSVAAF